MNTSRIQLTDNQKECVLKDLRNACSQLHETVADRRHDLAPEEMLPDEYWKQRIDIAKQMQTYTQIKTRAWALEHLMERGDNEWRKTTVGQDLSIQLRSLEAQVSLGERQQRDPTTILGEANNRLRQPMLQFWTHSYKDRNYFRFQEKITRRKLKLRKNLLACSSQRERERELEYQCPITGEWVLRNRLEVIQLFPYRGGQATMTSIFGPEAVGDLWSPDNGILVHDDIVDHLKKGYLLIVPTSPNDNVSQWHASESKEYYIHVINHTHEEISCGDADSPCKYLKLAGSGVAFPASSQPRGRYLQYFFMQSLLWQTWRFDEREMFSREEATSILRLYWDKTPGSMSWMISIAEAMGPSFKDAVKELTSNDEGEWVDLAKDVRVDTPLAKHSSPLAVASEHIAYHTIGQDFEDCRSDKELDDWDNESVPELVEYEPAEY
ncbi:MAG: hypothetical protein Q9170_007245 [Blastenia crenularia]